MAKGLHRIKVRAIDSIPFDVNIYQDAVLYATKTVQPVPTCFGAIIIKYLDNNEQYRFFPFEKLYDVNDRSRSIGQVEHLITSLYDSQSNTRNIGYRTDRTIVARADATAEQLLLLQDLPRSPRVYMRLSTDDSRWFLVNVSANIPVKQDSAVMTPITITITLPEQYNITML